MKVNDIRSFFGNKQGSSSTASPPPSPIEVPSRRSNKKAKKLEPPPPDSQEEVEISDEEDPLPRSHRDKKKSSKSSESSKKRKARVLSDSDDDDFVVKAKSREPVPKKAMTTKPVVEEKKKKEERKSIDPADFFSREKVKQEKVTVKPEKTETEQPASKREKRESSGSPAKKKEEVKFEKKAQTTPEKMKVKQEKTPEKSKPIKKDTPKFTPEKKPKKEEPAATRSSPRKQSTSKSAKAPVIEDSDSEPEFNPKAKPRKGGKGRSSASKHKLTITKPEPKKTPVKTTPEKKPETPSNVDIKKRAANYAKHLARQSSNPRHLGEKRMPVGTKDCLGGMTFVVTGVLDSLERDSCKALVEKHGGRVTTGISGKTTHLIVGDDPGESKIKKAEQLKITSINEDALFEMIRNSNPDGNNNTEEEDVEMMDLDDEDEEEPQPIKKTKQEKSEPVKTKKQETLPMKKENKSPKKVETMDATEQKQQAPMTDRSAIVAPSPSADLMWVDKYRPKTMKQVVGQMKDGSNASKLVRWLTNWFNHHGSSNDKPRPATPYFKDPEGKTFKCALLSGPPGIGKTTTAHLACKQIGYDYFEMNASDTRNKRGLHEHVSDALSCQTMYGGINELTKRHVLIMDEVDGMSGNEDRGGVQELIALIKGSRVPIICICNDRNHPKIRSLANYCFDLRFNRPTLQELKGFIAAISFKEKLKMDPQKVNQLCISTDMDIRQILHTLELYKESNADDVLAPKKDLRFGPWDVCRKVFLKPEHASMNIHEKNGLFFQDYNIGSLFVQENYPKWVPARAKRNKYARMELIARTAASIAEGDMAESMIRRSNNWSLLPVQAIFSSYVPGELMESECSGGIEFPQWLGKNSNKNKRHRLLQALHTHVHLEVSASLEALNMDYLPYLRRKISRELENGDIAAAANVMETYSLIRDDMESINDLSLWPGMKNPIEKLDSKTKAAFTRMVNKEVLPYSSDKPVGKRGRGKTTEMDEYGEEEEEEIVESEEEEKPEKDGMIKMKTKKADKKTPKSEEVAGPSKAKKSRKK